MSGTIYNKAFAVELSHNFFYYPTATPPSPIDNQFKVNQDIEIFPTSECVDLMNSGRMRFVRTGKGLIVFYQSYTNPSNVQEPFVKLADGAEFVFAIQLKAPFVPLVMNVSDLNASPKTYTAEKLAMLEKTVDDPPYTPGAENITLGYSLANSIRPSVFNYSFKPSTAYTGTAIVDVKVGAMVVLSISDIPYNPDTDSFTIEIDMRGKAKGFYTLEAYESDHTTSINSSDFYLDGDLANQNTFGVIRVKFAKVSLMYSSTSNPLSFKTFQYAIPVRNTYWRYYAVMKDSDQVNFTTDDLLVKDTTNAIAFTSTGQSDSTIKVNGFKVVLMKSNTKIPFSESTLQTLKMFRRLKVNPFTEKDIITPLQNAINDGTCSDRVAVAANLPQANDISEIFVIV